MSKESVPLSGVKTTRKRVAEKLELVMQVLSELDSNMRMADARGSTASTARSSDSGPDSSERRMVWCCVKSRIGGGPQESSQGVAVRSGQTSDRRRGERGRAGRPSDAMCEGGSSECGRAVVMLLGGGDDDVVLLVDEGGKGKVA
jgi:hypothetical protein